MRHERLSPRPLGAVIVRIGLLRHWAAYTLALGLIGMPHLALAQGLSVLTGEHVGFTRLVLLAPSAFDWTLSAEGRSRLVSLPANMGVIDLSRAFERIPRTRLAGLRQVAEGLELELACECSIRAWQDRPGLVILDIAEPTALPVTGPDTGVVAGPGITQPGSGDPEPGSGTAPAIDPARAAGLALARTVGPGPLAGGRDASTPAQPPDSMDPTLEEALRRHLARAFSEGAGQGLLIASAPLAQQPVSLVPAADPVPDTVPALTGAATDTTASVDGRTQAPVASPDLFPNLRMSSALARREPDPEHRADSGGPECVQASLFDSLFTPDPAPFADSVARIGRGLVGEFDIADAQAHADLAWVYLRHGLGAEARAVLNLIDPPPASAILLTGLADTLDNRETNSRQRLSDLIHCEGAVAVLAASAGSDGSRLSAIADALARDFPRLPAGLRSAIGPGLARQLIDISHTEAARIVIDSLRRGAADSQADVAALEAMLARSRDGPSRALAYLGSVSDTDVGALILRLRWMRDAGLEPDAELLNHAEALASAARATAEGQDLMHEVSRAWAHAGLPGPAFAALDRLTTWLPTGQESAQQLATLRNAAWMQTATLPDDRAFLTAILSRMDWRDPSLAPATRQALAGRLLHFGLTEQAIALLPEPALPEERLTRARAELARGAAQRALDLVADLMTEDAEDIRHAALGLLMQGTVPPAEAPQVPVRDTVRPRPDPAPPISMPGQSDPRGPQAGEIGTQDPRRPLTPDASPGPNAVGASDAGPGRVQPVVRPPGALEADTSALQQARPRAQTTEAADSGRTEQVRTTDPEGNNRGADSDQEPGFPGSGAMPADDAGLPDLLERPGDGAGDRPDVIPAPDALSGSVRPTAGDSLRDAIADQAGPLARAADLLDQSRSLRGAIADLLEPR